MPKSKLVDAYIAKSQPFARPILKHLRKLVHEAAPEVEEQIKWGKPCFMHNGIVCNMAAFKGHCSFGFWKAALMKDAAKLQRGPGKTSMGHVGRITSLDDLPSDATIRAYVKEAVALNAKGTAIKVPRERVAREPVVAPSELKLGLQKNEDARLTYAALSESQKRDYVRWINEAKRDETRARRIATTLEWLSEGKTFMWRYEKISRASLADE